jgi:hypothetical protein
MADKDKDEQEKTIAEDFVVTKYKMAGEISNRKLVSGFTSCFPARVFPFHFQAFWAYLLSAIRIVGVVVIFMLDS